MNCRRIASVGFTLLCLVIGCSTAVAQRTPKPERSAVEGFAVVRVVSNGGVSYQMLTVEETGGRRRNHVLSGPFPPGQDNPATYGGWLPPGEYRFLRLETVGVGFAFAGNVNLEGLLPTFTVEVGKLTDLGTLLQQPVGADRVTVVQWNDPRGFGQGRNNDGFAKAAPALTGAPILWDGTVDWQYADAPAIGGVAGGGLVVAAIEGLIDRANRLSMRDQWAKAVSPAELVELSKRATMSLGRPVFDTDGNAYFPSSLGQVLRRSRDGEWRNLDTGTLDVLGAVLVEGSNLYAGSLDGRLMTSADTGTTWSVAPELVDGPITSIARLSSGDFVVALGAKRGARQTFVLRGADFLALPSAPWETLELSGRLRNMPVRATVMQLFGDRVLTWVMPRGTFQYDISSDTWSGGESDSDIGELMTNAQAGLLYSSGMPDGVLSADGGESWQPITPGMNVGLGFRDAMNGIAVIADPKAFTVEHFVATTADAGKTWTRGGLVSGICLRALYLPPTDELVCLRNDGGILSTRTGAEWAIERIVY